jgi:hypothetical protein
MVANPLFLTFARWWHYDVDPLVKAMHEIIHGELGPLLWNEPGEDHIYHALYGMIRSLMLRFDQFNGLLNWAQHTWREDPKVRSHSNKKTFRRRQGAQERRRFDIPPQEIIHNDPVTIAGSFPPRFIQRHEGCDPLD